MKKILLFVLFIGLLSANIHAAIWYVNVNATGANNGTSWDDAYTDLQDGIAASAFGDEIWVAAGTYKPTSTTSRTISFSIKNGTKVYGGFNGTETSVSERNFDNNVTVLSGEIGTGAANDNTYTIVYFSNVGNQTIIDGFTIVSAYNPTGSGAGMRSNNSSPVIANCIIKGNYAEIGGGINHGGSGNITLSNCIFDGNISSTQGGAINLFVGTNNISNCYFKSNQSNNIGGAISIAGTNAITTTISNSVFAGNVSSTSGSALYFNAECLTNLYNCLIVGNYAGTYGVIYTPTSSSTKSNKVINCTIAHNGQMENGANSRAVWLNVQSSYINSIIYGNTAAAQVINLTGLTINNCIMQSGSTNITGTNLLFTDPKFVQPGSAANAPFDTTSVNYRLDIFSPAIDFGVNGSVIGTEDVVGNQRIYNTTVDVGAYESNYCVSSLALSPAAPYVVCGGTPITLSVNDAVNTLWSTGSTNNSITVSSAGTYSVVFEDANGCRGKAQATVTSSALPNPSITFASGNLNAGNFSTYQWSFNGNPISGATTSTHVPLEGYGNYTVDVTNSSGCSGTGTYCLSPATVTASGPLNFCQGESVTLTVNNGTSQVWSTGSLDAAISVSTSGTYSVTVMNTTAGCSVNFQQIVTVTNNPVPTITVSGGNLTTQAYASYQWSYNGTPISGATSQVLVPANGNGPYTVTVTNSTGCEGTSSVFQLNNVGVNELTSDKLTVYPNPLGGSETLYLSWEHPHVTDVTIQIFNQSGAVVYSLKSGSFPASIQLPDLNTGLYFMDIEAESVQMKKLKLVVF
jgi:hypothetical protein